MAVLRGVLLFAFFGGLVWLAVSHGGGEGDGGADTGVARAAERSELSVPGSDSSIPPETALFEAQSGNPAEFSDPTADAGSALESDWVDPQEESDRAAADVEPLALEEDPYVLDRPIEEPEPEAADGQVSILGFDELLDGDGRDGPESAAPADVDGAAGSEPEAADASSDRELPGWLATPNEEDDVAEQPRGDLSPPARGSVTALQLQAPRSESTELAGLLLDAVFTGDPEDLNVYFNRGDVAGEAFNVVSAFWMAVTGDTQQGGELAERLEAGGAVSEQQLNLLAAALDGGRPSVMEASFGRRDPLALAMTMVLLHRDAQVSVRESRFREACEVLSDLVQYEVDAPWGADKERLVAWGELLNDCQDRHRLNPRGEWPALEYEVQGGDNLIAIRKKVIDERRDLLLCTGLIEQTNDISGYLQPGMRLRIPTSRPNVVVDLDSRVVLYRHGDEIVRVWIVGVGKEGHETPTGDFVAGEKQKEPAWMPVGGRQLPYGHPDNPLGTRWIEWYRGKEGTSFGFHGTSDPGGVGDRVSQGCVRMHNEHVEELYDLLPKGAQIRVQS